MHERRRYAWAPGAVMLAALCGAPRAALAVIPPDFAEVASSYGAPADFDCDHRADISRRIHNGIWEIDLSANGFGHSDLTLPGYGDATAIPVPADYDGDCRADLSVKDAAGYWYIDYARDGFGAWNEVRPGYGPDTSVPIPADYDGDGKTDLAVKDEAGTWYIDYAFNGFGAWNAIYYGYGGPNAVPVPADYDGDRRADLSVKADDGCWYIDYASDGFGAWNAIYCGYGDGSAVPVPADYDGDGKADLSVRGSDRKWYIDYAAGGFGAWNAIYQGYSVFNVIEPLPADYDGDGRADLSLHSFEESWYIDFSGNGFGNTAPFDLHDPLGRPVTPKMTLTHHTAHYLRIVATSQGPDLQGHSSAEQVFLTFNGVTSGVFGMSAARELKNLASDTQYCLTAKAVNSEGSATRTACFRTDYEPPPPPPPTPAGISRIDVFNCHSDGHTLHIWTFDFTLGAWQERGTVAAQWDANNSCPGSAAPFVVNLADGHNFRFVAVDPEQITCGGVNDPQNGGCQRSLITVVTGLASGPAFRHVIN